MISSRVSIYVLIIIVTALYNHFSSGSLSSHTYQSGYDEKLLLFTMIIVYVKGFMIDVPLVQRVINNSCSID